MSDVLVIAAHALRESLRRRVFIVVVVLTLGFGGLYTWGATELFKDVSGFSNNEFGLDARTLAGATLLGLAMFGTLFLGAVLAVFLTSTANGIGVLMVFGAGLLAGLLGSIGDALNSHTLQKIANTSSWVLPFEALYRDALRLLVQDIPGVTGAIVQLGPLGGSHDAGPLLLPWIVVYVALVALVGAFAFGRRDL